MPDSMSHEQPTRPSGGTLHVLARAVLLSLFGLCTLAHAQDVTADEPRIVFHHLPSPYQLFPRDARNQAVVPISGFMEAPGLAATVQLDVYENGMLIDRASRRLEPGVNGDTAFDFRPRISARLSDYRFIVSLLSSGPPTVVADIDHISCGDVFLVQGQSNAVARDVHRQGAANQWARQWVRSYGSASFLPSDVLADDGWYIADGEEANSSGTIGAWALRMAAQLVDEFQIPVVILNGAIGGSTIYYHQRNDFQPDDTGTHYGRLLFRARRSGLAASARALFWYQGEADGGNVALHGWGFRQLFDDWLLDYPALEKIYVFQVRSGCGAPSLELRDLQARLEEQYEPIVETMATNGLPGHDGCHYWFSGYQLLGEHIARLVRRDLYGAPADSDVEAPRVVHARYLSPARDTILLEFESVSDTLFWTPGSEGDFLLNGTSAVVSGTSLGHSVLLRLEGPSSADRLTYTGHAGDGPWVTNKNGVGLLSFIEPIAMPEGSDEQFTTHGRLLRPLLVPDGKARGRIRTHRDVALGRQWLTIKTRKLPGADLPFSLFLEDLAGSDSLLDAGTLNHVGKGRHELEFDSQLGQSLPFGVDNIADLAGRRIELRDGAGLVHLEARLPPVSQVSIDEQRPLVAPVVGPLDAALTDPGAATGTVTVTLNPTSGRQTFQLKAAKLQKKTRYDIFLENPIDGGFTRVDTLESSRSGKLKLRTKSWMGDTFPLGVLSIEELSGLVVEVRNAEYGLVELSGQIAQM
jgi:hypothetical protein